jgi:hypothetical protein
LLFKNSPLSEALLSWGISEVAKGGGKLKDEIAV